MDLDRLERRSRSVARLAVAALVLVVLVPAASVARADGCPPETCGAVSVAVPGARLLAVRPLGQNGPLVAYDLATAQRRFALPSGMVSADGRRFFTAHSSHGETTIARYDARTGRRIAAWPIRGAAWWLGAVSSSGRWIVVGGGAPAPGRTKFEVLDGRRGSIVHFVSLRGLFQPDGISADGRRLYLLQYFNRPGYLVRLYDLTHGRLVKEPLRDSDDKGRIRGVPYLGLPSPDGRWLLTLYLEYPTGASMVHTLDTARSRAVCIGLPKVASRYVQEYGLALRGSRLYAVNPAAGVLAVVDLRRLVRVRTVRFEPDAPGQALAGNASVSSSGRAVAFGAGARVWRYQGGGVHGPYAVRGPLAALAFAPGDRRIVAVSARGRTTVLDARTGRRLDSRS
jgi:hypothetical protein